MARTYSEVPEPRYVERAKFADNGGGGGGGDILTVPIVFNMEDLNLSYLDITAKELFDLLQTEKIILVKGSITYSEEHMFSIEYDLAPIVSAYREESIDIPDPQAYVLYEFAGFTNTGLTLFEAHADDEKPVLKQ